ncbi:MAG: hypothetical protein HY240_10990 [Actinobacteria bacterium]|nr:hypothetical protein [Actinomycetota bacterium]
MGWLFLAGFGIMWVAFLLPTERRRRTPWASVEDFERRMELLAQVETHGGPGRWIVTPRKGARFVGPAERSRARARERRKRVFTFLLESIGITFLIGIVPPLRVMWTVSGLLVGLLAVYVWMLLSLKEREPHTVRERVAAAHDRPGTVARMAAKAQRYVPQRQMPQRYVAEGRSSWARPTFNGLGSLGEGDRVHVVVRSKNEVRVAGA